jgi:hypothetical protein
MEEVQQLLMQFVYVALGFVSQIDGIRRWRKRTTYWVLVEQNDKGRKKTVMCAKMSAFTAMLCAVISLDHVNIPLYNI